MNVTLDVIQGLRERGAIPDGDAHAYMREAIAVRVTVRVSAAHGTQEAHNGNSTPEWPGLDKLMLMTTRLLAKHP